MWTLARVAAAVACGAALGAVTGCAGNKRTQNDGGSPNIAPAPKDAAAGDDTDTAPTPQIWGAGAKKVESDRGAAKTTAAVAAPIGPPAKAPTPGTASNPAPAPGVRETPIEQVSAAPPEAPKKGKKSESRADGRPEWWLDAPKGTDGRWMVSAEAVGDDVLSARRAAVEAGRDALRRALGGAAATDERIISTSVRPLPSTGVGAAGKRFVGYVLMSGAAG